MEYKYPEIQGKTISYEEIKDERVRELVDAVSRHPYITLDNILRQDDGTEIILAICDVQVKQHTVVDIKECEEIAIICDTENLNFPEVYALRGDFPLGLPHTNLKLHERPVSLCVNEFLYKEVKHLFNPYIFLESIRIWFSLTSSGKLHQDDQQLEPYFHTKGYIITPPLTDLLSQQRYSVKQIPSSSFPLYELQVTNNVGDPYICDVWKTDSQVSGFIHKMPTRLGDIKSLLSSQENNIIEGLAKFLVDLKRDLTGKKDFLDNKYAILFIIPTKRNLSDEEPEKTDSLFVTIDETLKKLGISLGLWTEHDNKLCQIVTNPDHTQPDPITLLSDVPISIYSTLSDFVPETAAMFNGEPFCQDVYSIIGVGALGSQLLNNLCRMGFGKWIIIDNDTLLPHNLARHLLSKYHVGMNKSMAVSLSINHLLSSPVAVPLDLDFVTTPLDILMEKLKGSKAIIDTSTSIAVARRLTLDFEPEITAPRISLFLTPSGNDLVLLSEDSSRTYRLDLLEMQYYRTIYQEEALHEHLKREVDSKIRYVSHSCRDITQKISQDKVAVHSAIASKALKQTLLDGNSMIAIWQIINDSFEIKKYEFTPTSWEKFECENWTIFVDTWAISKMLEHRKSNLPCETGGVLIGSIDYQRKILYLIDSLLAPSDSIKTGSSFIRGVDGLQVEYDTYLKLTDNQVIYLGEWHSHPNKCSTRPSADDNQLFSYLSDTLRQEGNPTLMLIVGDTSMNFIFDLI